MDHPIDSCSKLTAPLFGVAGFPPNFFKSEWKKKRENIFQWLNSLHLDWVELQNTYGVKMKDEQAHLYREKAKQFRIGISLHGPYYITLASGDRDVVKRSRERLLQCVHLASEIGASRIIFHPGYYPGKSEEDRALGVRQIIRELNALKSDIPAGIFFYPETAGKRAQIGSLDEILEICEKVEITRPCLDLAHIHGFTRGTLNSEAAIEEVFSRVIARFGQDYLSQLHIHMYPVDFDKNGERTHKAFSDHQEYQQFSFYEPVRGEDRYYPLAEDFVSVIKRMEIAPVVVCEARDTQDVGAALMKNLYWG